MPFNQRLKELRLQNNLSQSKLARELDIATRTYIYYETGQKYPSLKLLTKFADFFNVSISFLMEGQDDEQVQDNNLRKLRTEQLVEEICGRFAEGDLSESEKDAVMEAVQEAYQKAKSKNKQA